MADLIPAVTETVDKFDKVAKEYNAKVKASSKPKKEAEPKK